MDTAQHDLISISSHSPAVRNNKSGAACERVEVTSGFCRCTKQENTKQETLTTWPWASWTATHNAGPQAWIIAFKDSSIVILIFVHIHSWRQWDHPKAFIPCECMWVMHESVSYKELQIYLWYYSVVKRVYKALCLDMNSCQCSLWEEQIGMMSYNSLSVFFCTVVQHTVVAIANV